MSLILVHVLVKMASCGSAKMDALSTSRSGVMATLIVTMARMNSPAALDTPLDIGKNTGPIGAETHTMYILRKPCFYLGLICQTAGT